MPLGPALFLLSCVTGKFVPDSEWFQAYLLLLGLDWICVLQNAVFLKITLLFLKSIEQLSNVVLVCLMLSQKVAIQHGSVFVSGTECSEMQQGWWFHEEANTPFHKWMKCNSLFCQKVLLSCLKDNSKHQSQIFFSQYIHILIVQINSQADHWTVITVLLTDF